MTSGDRSTGRSVAWIFLVWLVLQVGGMFSPGLLDDVDSVYLEVAREMLHRHDFVTPYVDGIRFFDKPPLMYWMAAGSMKVFGEHDWAARLPLALAVLGLLLAVYGLARRIHGERAGFYAALVLGTSVGPYLYTRFFIPDILICLWMTLGVWISLAWMEATCKEQGAKNARSAQRTLSSAFGVVLGLNLLTKGLIGLVFPLGFVVIYLALTRQIGLLRRMRPGCALLAFAVVALPWHVLAALRNPAIAMPAGVGLPARAGWAWFYLYNEHVARFLGRRIPHDYGNTPVGLFLLYALIWIMPWGVFLLPAVAELQRSLGHHFAVTVRQQEAALTGTIWALLVLGFFSVSSRQEYYSLPALPALALVIGGVLARAESGSPRSALLCHRWGLLPLTCAIALICGYFAIFAPRPAPGADLATLLAVNPEMYNLSLGHLFDLTGAAMGLFRGPLATVAVAMLIVGPVSYSVRRRGRHYGSNLLLAGGMLLAFSAAHEALIRFNPILGSKTLAEAIVREQRLQPRGGDVIVLDGELTSGSTLLFYTGQPVHLVNGRVNGPWFGSFWPDSPAIFEDEGSLRKLWGGPRRVFLMTYEGPRRQGEFGGRMIGQAGGKTVLVSR